MSLSVIDTIESKINKVMLESKSSSIVACVVQEFGAENGLQIAIKEVCEYAHTVVRDSSDAQLTSIHGRIHLMLSMLYYINHIVVATLEVSRLYSEGPRSTNSGAKDQNQRATLTAGIARFSAPDPEEANRIQQLILYLLDTVHVRGYRRRNGMLFKRKVLAGRSDIDTHAWDIVSDIRTFIYDATCKEVNYDMWLNMTCMRGNVSAAIEYLTHCQDVQLPDLRRDRHAFAFLNGIYLAKEDRFVEFGTPEHAALPTHLVVSRFFDFEVNPDHATCEDASSIPTPHLQSILDYQSMSAEVCWWMYVMIGRLIYDVNELDGWQVIPFLKGAASSGKSTILTRVCQSLYERDDVGVLSNNIERKFGLSAIYDKLIFIGPEIKSDIQLEQSEFQSIISGECVQVSIKCQTAKSIVWVTPGALAGNEVPKWVDNSGSINRRIVLFEFPKRVHDGDMQLGRKLEAEMPSILIKANRHYLDAVRKFARDNIWKHLPREFHLAKEEFSEAVNSIVHFLKSGRLVFDKDKYMPFEHFSSAYETYVTSMGLVRLKLTGDRINQPLMDMGCKIHKQVTMRYPRSSRTVHTGRFIIGVDILETLTTTTLDPPESDPLLS